MWPLWVQGIQKKTKPERGDRFQWRTTHIQLGSIFGASPPLLAWDGNSRMYGNANLPVQVVVPAARDAEFQTFGFPCQTLQALVRVINLLVGWVQ